MFRTNGDNIYISRGEDASLVVSTVDAAGNEYEFNSGDLLSLTVRDPISREKRLSLYSDSGVFDIKASCTAGLGGRYDYEAALEYADGHRAVIIGKTPNHTPHFYVMEG